MYSFLKSILIISCLSKKTYEGPLYISRRQAAIKTLEKALEDVSVLRTDVKMPLLYQNQFVNFIYVCMVSNIHSIKTI